MSLFKAGDLALIIGGDNPHEIGRQVELIQLVKNGEGYTCDGFPRTIWNVAGSDVWVVKGNVRSVLKGGSIVDGFTQKAPYNLLPLRGQFTPETERETELTQ